jgi:hypothetical protein
MKRQIGGGLRLSRLGLSRSVHDLDGMGQKGEAKRNVKNRACATSGNSACPIERLTPFSQLIAASAATFS